ncbi:hypothetical protein OTU49_011706, partial [Cherax quadricarinatus]
LLFNLFLTITAVVWQYSYPKSGSWSSSSLRILCTTSLMPLTKSYAWFLFESRGFDNLYPMAGSGYGLECWGFDTAPTGHSLRLISFAQVIENSIGELMRSNQISPFINQFMRHPLLRGRAVTQLGQSYEDDH